MMFSHIAFILFLAVVIAAVQVTTSPSGDALTPDDAIFVTTRCIEEWSPWAKTHSIDVRNWRQWKFEPVNEHGTHCFTKCLLKTIGIFDVRGAKFKGDRIVHQWETYAKEIGTSDLREQIENFSKDLDSEQPLKSSKCDAVSKAYVNKYGKYADVIRKIFFIDETTAKKFYESKGDTVKKNGQSYFEFCENKYYPAGSANRKDLCKVRSYKVLEDENFKNHINCIFKGLRYLDRDNEIDPFEIDRDFELVKKVSPKMVQALSKCLKENGKDPLLNAFNFYKCMLNDPIAEDFKEAFNYREIRSQDYDYILKGIQTYDKNAIDQKVKEVDKKQCP